MSDTATKQPIKGDLDERVDVLDNDLDKLRLQAIDGALTLLKTVKLTKQLEARLDKLEKRE